MKLIQKTRLVFREGKSDKVYEVDLCEVGADQFVVNFRYGRRGASLKEGTKTSAPVARAKAEKTFADLVQSKVSKGYRDATQETASEPAKAKIVAVDSDARNQAVLNRLADWQSNSKWPLERAVWRAGELKLKAAAPLLINLFHTGDALRDYCVAWALGWCGDQRARSPLLAFINHAKTSEAARRIATEAWLKLADEEDRNRYRSELIDKLPVQLRELARRGPAEEFSTALKTYLEEGDYTRFDALDLIYLIDNVHTRPALLELIKTAPLAPNYFQRFRHIFKASEYRRDAEVFGLLAYRFEKTPALFRNAYFPLNKKPRWSGYINLGNQWIQDPEKAIAEPDSKICYGVRTRSYLRRRVWRTLRRMGELGETDFVKMAVGLLLPYSDSDAAPPKEASFFDIRIHDHRKAHWDRFAPYWAFNHILYRNSPRYEIKSGTWFWRCQKNYRAGDPAPEAREEAFPKLWEQVPAGLVHLIVESGCEPVVHFAARALRDCELFCALLDVETVMMILGRPYTDAARLGFELAGDIYDPQSPNLALVLAVAGCAFDEARAQACRWVDENRDVFLADGDFVVAIVTSAHGDVRKFARNLLRSSSFSDDTAKMLIARLVAYLMSMDSARADEARDIADTILKSFGTQLKTIGMRIVLDLLAHPLLGVQELGGNILLIHDTRPEALPSGIIDSLIDSDYPSIRGIGIKLLANMNTVELANREATVVSLALSHHEDVRNAVRPVVKVLCRSSETLAERLAELFLESLFKAEPHEGVHAGLARMLVEDTGSRWMKRATRGTVWRLIQSESAAAQELGGLLIEYKINSEALFAEGFDFDDLAELSNHEVRAVRQSAWLMFSKMLHRLSHQMNPQGHLEEMARAVRLLDARWDDSRKFWIDAFSTYFTAQDFTPGILVSVCDSVRADVQQLGRQLITRFFAEEDGDEYLLKLSEHPTIDLQLFATNYLERYAADNPARLGELRHYFISVLSRVNKARAAKDRVTAFLAREAEKSEQAARIVAEILTRQSLTVAVGDKAAAIEAMLRIRERYPDIALPIRVREPEVRHAV
jgi:predicted DNA-binding WGR domain protein